MHVWNLQGSVPPKRLRCTALKVLAYLTEGGCVYTIIIIELEGFQKGNTVLSIWCFIGLYLTLWGNVETG